MLLEDFSTVLGCLPGDGVGVGLGDHVTVECVYQALVSADDTQWVEIKHLILAPKKLFLVATLRLGLPAESPFLTCALLSHVASGVNQWGAF